MTKGGIIFLLWLILYFTQYYQTNPELIWAMISISMFFLIIISFFVIYTDLGFYGIKFHKPFLAIIIAGSIFLYSITMLNLKIYIFSEFNFDIQLFSTYMQFIKKPIGAIVMVGFTSTLFYLSYRIFISRKSYLT